ncbi:hypothetical protein IMZ31_22695 (plasmid) [Pontibacillus sp. ALD_SL1]|uniref:hypothetical protein n=1 Tax=Pontibacillus sp. ALD_SL1 TaxID=2777185 RepID=UPI001A95A39C|nr:hypothetical protein [Pontibacillus sp. ALD_SL1]QST02266.1 hypothetical protein IMZ31_22695 [Pontibacillus sp. ALD_SL1]
MSITEGIFIAQTLFVIIILLLGWFFWDKRYKEQRGNGIPEGFEETSEVTIDPVSKQKQRVFYNKETGERIYIKEDKEG